MSSSKLLGHKRNLLFSKNDEEEYENEIDMPQIILNYRDEEIDSLYLKEQEKTWKQPYKFSKKVLLADKNYKIVKNFISNTKPVIPDKKKD